MKTIKLILSMAMTGALMASATEYTDGVLFVNESQYGKGNGSLNCLLPEAGVGQWHYRAFRDVNPGKEFGCTPSFGAYHGGRLYVVSKFAKDPGAEVTGGILTVADGATLEWIGQIDALDPSGERACGRAFLGIGEGKGYVSSSNGIWVVDLGNLSVKGQIPGSENPYGTDSKPVGDPTSAIYFGQCGAMVKAGGRVFAAHQSKGVLVIDPATDKVTDVISMDFVRDGAGVGSVVRSADGMVWASVTETVDGDGYMLGSLVRIDPATLQTTAVTLPAGCYPPSSSWAAWTPDTFCASAKSNLLFWTGGSSSWFANQLVFCHDIDAGTTSCIVNFEDDEDMWKVCCPSLRVDPADDTLYMTLFKDVSSTQYMVRSYTPAGIPLRDYPMERGYWFPGEILFPATQLAGIESVSADGTAQEFSVAYRAGILTVTGTDRLPCRATVTDFSGRTVAALTLDEHGCAPVAVPAGLYLLRLPQGACKFTAR